MWKYAYCGGAGWRYRYGTNQSAKDGTMTSAWPSIESDLTRRTLAIVMAGGNGTRLGRLTERDSKPALPFAGQYRNIDFPLSNCVNSGVRRIAVATQYKAHSLIQHVSRGWSFLRPEVGEGIELWPAQQRCGARWYAGTADAIRQNLDLIDAHAPEHVLVLAGDHVYKMDYRPMLYEHAASGADVTVGCIEVPLAQAGRFGIMQADDRNRVIRFEEKPRVARPSPHGAATALASMGIYVFGIDALARCLRGNETSAHDFGRDILPELIARARVSAFAFRDARRGGPAYWRDVGTIESYWRAHMDLLEDDPAIDLADPEWPIWTHQPHFPPARFLGGGVAVRSIVSSGCSIAGLVEHSVLSPACRLGAGSHVAESVLLPGVEVGRNCVIRRAIVDGDCRIPEGLELSPATVGAEADDSDGPIALVTPEVVERAAAEAQPRAVNANR